MITELFSPKSKGSVTLKSSDPLENPIVDCNYLSDPLDLLVMTEGVRFGNEIVMQGAGTKNIVKGSWPSGTLQQRIRSCIDIADVIDQISPITLTPHARNGYRM